MIDRAGRVVGVAVGGNAVLQAYNYAIPARHVSDLPGIQRELAPGIVRPGEPVRTPLISYILRRSIYVSVHADQAYRRGRTHLEAGRCEQAKHSFEEALSQHRHPRYAYELGWTYFTCWEDYATMRELSLYSLSLGAEGSLARLALTGLARANIGVGDYADAINAAIKALEIDDRSSAAPYVLLGDANYRLRRFLDARRAYRDALRIEPRNLGALAGKVFTLLEVDEPDQAMEYLDRIRRIDPAAAQEVRRRLLSPG